MYQPIEFKEFSAVSQIDWKLTVLARITWTDPFVVMSEDVDFKEAEAKWSLQLSSCSWGTSSIFVVSRFFLQKEKFDRYATFKFDILLKDGTILSSPLFSIMNPTFEYQLQQYISVQEGDMLEITPKVTFYTLKMCKEIPSFVKNGLNAALEVMLKADEKKEEEAVKLAFKALNNAINEMGTRREGQDAVELQMFSSQFEKEVDAKYKHVEELETFKPEQQVVKAEAIEREPQNAETVTFEQVQQDAKLEAFENEQQVPSGTLNDTLELASGDEDYLSDDEEFVVVQESLEEQKISENIQAPPAEPQNIQEGQEAQDNIQAMPTEPQNTQEYQEAQENIQAPQNKPQDASEDKIFQDEHLDAEVSEINAQQDAEDTYRAFESFNKALQDMIFADDAETLVGALKDILKAAENPNVAIKLSEEAEKARENSKKAEEAEKAASVPQDDADVADFDHCSDIEVISDAQESSSDILEDEFDHCSDVEAPINTKEVKFMPIEAKNSQDAEKEARIAQGNQKEAIKNRHSACILLNDDSDDDFDHCTENGAADKVYRSEATVKVHCNDENCSKPPVEPEESNISSFSIEIPNFGKITLPTSNPADQNLLKLISDVYLGNMKMVADASAALLVFAAQNKNKKILDDCLEVLVSQITLNNFIQIWHVGDKLKIQELKDKAIKFAIKNTLKGWYNRGISPDMMVDFVKSL